MTGQGGEPPSSLLSGRLANPHLVFRSQAARSPVSSYPPSWDGALKPEPEIDDGAADATLAPLLGTLESRVASFAATQETLFERQEELFRRTRTGLDGLTPAAEADFALARLQSMRTAVDAAKAELAAGAERASKDIRSLKTTLKQIGARLDASVERTEQAMTLLERAMEKESAERGARQTELTALGSLVEALDGQLRERDRHAADPPPRVLADKILALSGRLAQIEDDLAVAEAAAPPPGAAARAMSEVTEGLAAHESRTSALILGLETKIQMLWTGLKRSAESHGSMIERMGKSLSGLTSRVSHLERTIAMRAARAPAAPRADAGSIAPSQADRPAQTRRAPGRSILSRRLLNIARSGSTPAILFAALVAVTALLGAGPALAQSPLTDDEIEIAPSEDLFTDIVGTLVRGKIEPSSVDLLLDAARAGDPVSQYVLSLAYRTGAGIGRDLASANLWQERAAQQGLAIAALAMGQRRFAAPEDLAADRSPETAYAWFRRAADGGNLKAMYNVAVALAAGDGVERNARDAAQWFSEAARRGYVDAQYNLGLLYAHGYGVHQSDAIAYMWLAIAAAQGDRSAAQRRDDLVTRLAPEIRERLDAYAVAFEPLPADPIANGLFPTAPETYIASLARTGEPLLVDRARPDGTDGGTPAAAVLRRGNGPT